MNLRAAVLVVAGAAIAGGLIALALGAFPPAWIFGLWGVLLVVGTVYERVRYKPLLEKRPGPGWEKTPERFIDPESGDSVTVYVEPRTGERLYVRE